MNKKEIITLIKIDFLYGNFRNKFPKLSYFLSKLTNRLFFDGKEYKGYIISNHYFKCYFPKIWIKIFGKLFYFVIDRTMYTSYDCRDEFTIFIQRSFI